MKKQTLEEQKSRIKDMMGLNEDFSINNEGQITSVDDVVDYLMIFAKQLQGLQEQFYEKLSDTKYWSYVKDIYSKIDHVSETEHTTFPIRGNVVYSIDLLKSDFNQDDESEYELPGHKETMDNLNNLSIRK